MTLWPDRQAGVAPFVALALPLLLASAAFAVDLGSVQLETRRLQGIADAAALSAAVQPLDAQRTAALTVVASNWPRPVTTRAIPGRYASDAAVAATDRFVAGSDGADAVKVTLTSTAPTFFATIFGQQAIPIARSAIAARQRQAAFAIGSRLASLDGGIANAMLSAFAGSRVSLTLLDYRAVASADVDLFGFLDAVRTRGNLTAGSYGELLSSEIAVGDALRGLAAQLDVDRQGAAAAAIRALAGSTGKRRVTLARLLDAGPYAGRLSGASGLVRVDALSLVTALLQTDAANRQFETDFGGDVPGIASTHVTVAVGERMQQSPWIAVTSSGAPIVRTAQTRIWLDTRLSPVALSGSVTPVAIRVPLYVELASAEARLAAISCAGDPAVTLEARPSPGRAAIADIDPGRFGDFGSTMPLPAARLVELPLLTVDGSAEIELGAAEPWQRVPFTRAEIDGRIARSVTSAHPIASLGTSLTQRMKLATRLLGIGLGGDAIGRGVGAAVAAAAPSLDTVIGVATGAIGLKVGEADVTVTGLRCGAPVLVG